MKKHSILLAGLIASSNVVIAQEQISDNKLNPTNPKNFTEVSKYQHRIKTDNKSHPKPPRLVSPNEYQRIQAKMATDFDTFSAPSKDALSVKRNPVLSKISTKPNKASSLNSLTTTGCASPNDLIGLSGETLITALKSGDLTACLYGLYDSSLAGGTIFSDANLLTVAQAINTMLVTYTGEEITQAEELEKLISYLRAMHWVESSTDRVFQNDYQITLKQAFDTYFSGEHFITFNGEDTRDFMNRFEMLILVNISNTDRVPYLARFSEALLGYANSVDRSDGWGVYYEEQGFTNLLVQFFNANNYDEQSLKAELLNKPEIIGNLINFVTTDGLWLVDHTREYQWADTISELGRLLKFTGEIADRVRPTIANILSTYAYNEKGSSGWVNAQGMVKFFDSANCSAYGNACDFDLEGAVLSGNHACSATVQMRYQGIISDENLQATCDILNAGQAKFHSIFGTNANTPVANDFNEALEVVVFSSSTGYQSFAGDFFGINTDNGGMYLEDTPASESSQARFIAYQATWLPGFNIWNLESK